jgi:hypothetical protein
MPEVMRIRSRDAFTEVLAEARAHASRQRPTNPPLFNLITAQLEHMARATADDRVPDDAERVSTNLGPLAARNLEQSHPQLADQLEELDYTFHRYPQLCGGQAHRRGILQVWTGPGSFKKLVLEPGEPRTVGTADADLVVHGDPPHARQFQILWDGVSAHVLAFEPHRLTLGGEPGWVGELANRGWMTAGATTFLFHVEDWTPPPTPVHPTAASDAALAELRPLADTGALYAVIDAARSARARELLAESVDPHASLYDGEQGRAFDEVAPYLVHLRADSQLLDRLVREGWGDAWGIYLASGHDFDAVRRHLRRFLLVDEREQQRRLLFRFYDPRVLRSLADIFTREQTDDLTGALDVLLYEREDHTIGALRRRPTKQ